MLKHEKMKLLEYIRGECSEEEAEPVIKKLREEIERDQRWKEWGAIYFIIFDLSKLYRVKEFLSPDFAEAVHKELMRLEEREPQLLHEMKLHEGWINE